MNSTRAPQPKAPPIGPTPASACTYYTPWRAASCNPTSGRARNHGINRHRQGCARADDVDDVDGECGGYVNGGCVNEVEAKAEAGMEASARWVAETGAALEGGP